MKRLPLLLALVTVGGPWCAFAAAPEDDRVAARASALELAGAWGNDGFKVRDGFWSGTIKQGQPKIVQVNLYAGNQYWFTAAAAGNARKLAVTVYDETGKPVAAQLHEDGTRAAAGFSPTASGPYLVKIDVTEGEAGSVALIYSYK